MNQLTELPIATIGANRTVSSSEAVAPISFKTLGHAGLWCELGGVTLVCDPWLSDTGAFLSSWHVFPTNDHLDRNLLLAPDYIYISHIHEDHFDRTFLSLVDKSATVLIPNFPDKRLRSQLRALGFGRVLELDDFDVFPLSPEVDVRMIIQEIPDWHDSALLIDTPYGVVLNQNDCKLNEEQLGRLLHLHGSPSLYYAQFSPANWYPIAYGYPVEKERRIKRLERQNQLALFLRQVAQLAPRLVVPFAGPPALLDPDMLTHCLGNESMFPMMSEAAALVEQCYVQGELPTRAVVLLPGDVVHLPALDVARDSYWDTFDFARKDDYLVEYAARRAPTIAAYRATFPEARPELFVQFTDFINRLGANHPYIVNRVNMTVLFRIKGLHGGCWLADFRRTRDMVMEVDGGHHPYCFSIEARHLQAVMDEEISFDGLLLSLRFSARRVPDLYNQDLMTLLKRDDTEALRSVEAHRRRQQRKVHIELQASGSVYRVEKYCPHAGGNLQHAHIEDGVLTCPMHGWKFRVADGRCLTARCRDLDITEARNSLGELASCEQATR